MRPMKRFFVSFLAIFFPWLIFVLEGRLELAVLSIVLQASLIGWIPISVVAWKHREAFGIGPKKSEEPDQSNKTE